MRIRSTGLAAIGLLLIVTACSRDRTTARIDGTVRLTSVIDVDTVYVGVYPLSHRNRLGRPAPFHTSPLRDFRFALTPGQYIIAAFARGHKPHRQPLLILSADQHIRVTFSLAPLTIPEQVSAVSAFGDFCQWDARRAVPLTRTGDYWTLQDRPAISPGSSYLLNVNGTIVADLMNPAVTPVPWFATINSRYTGDGIVFNPSLYFTTPRYSDAAVSGARLHDEFEMLIARTDALEDTLTAFKRKSSTVSRQDWNQNCAAALAALDGLEKWAPLPLRPLVQEKQLAVTGAFHPALYDLNALFAAGAPDDDALQGCLLGTGYRTFLHDMLARVRALPQDSPVLQGTFQQDISRMAFWAGKFPAVQQAYQQEYTELDELLMGFVDNAALPTLRRDLLVQTAARYSQAGRPQLTRALIARLRTEFPDDRFVTDGGADRILRRLALEPGQPAPPFTVTTTDGNTLSLADLRGSHVFIDFWGTWCPPCREELPNVSRLARSWPDGSVRVLGLAKDDPGALRAFLKKQPLPYPNAVADDSLLARYAISSYPTTLLIGPDGNIAARGLRGRKLVERVREVLSR